MEKGRQSRESRGGGRKRIVITECEVTPVDAHGFGFGLRGLASVTLNNALVLRSIRVLKDREGNLTVAYPAQMGRDKTWYDVVEPKSDSLRGEIDRRVIAEYNRAVEELEAAQEAEEEAASEASGAEAEGQASQDDEPQLAEVHRETTEGPPRES